MSTKGSSMKKLCFVFAVLVIAGLCHAQSSFPGVKQSFHGFDMYIDGATKIVAPKQVADGKPWVWRARFFGHQPQFDIAMLNKGYHVVYCDVANLLGSPEAVTRWNDFYGYLRFEHRFADRVVLEGMSRGGLIIYNWAVANPDKVAAIYGDAPVMDFKSWPGGKGKSKGSPRTWQQCLSSYGLTEQKALAYAKNPIDSLAPLAKAGVPIIHVVGDADGVVPVAENTTIAEKRYKAMGGIFETIHKPGVGHHPHSLKDPSEIVNFVLKHSKGVAAVIAADSEISDKNFHLRGNYDNSRAAFEQTKRGHVAFLGGSITEMDGYRPMVCEMLKRRFPATEFTFTAAGISSTCSDTGAFRLTRDVLSKGPVDLLFVEFSVNDDQDGVYSQQSAVRGMEGILAQTRVHNPNADIVMTHFVNEKMLAALRAGKPHGAHDAHAAVAEHHGVSNNDLAQELADQINAGSMDWKTFGGVHPKKPGNRMCADMIENALLKAWERPLAADHKVEAHTVRPLMDEFSYVRGRFVDLKDIELDDTWTVSVPEWTQGIDGRVRIRFVDDTMIHGSTVGGKLKVSFTGTAIGAYVLSGPDAAIVRCSIDGKPAVEIDPIHKHSGFHYPQTVMFFDDLQRGDHVMDLEIIENRPGRTRPGGTAFRALHFTAN
jgi:pimeloyl-ACP methyl ester carboxylesterase/lysophospholipase L1-like esterase